jgi:SynChlorMet cassette radical SAM/SPASM protein ScmF
MDKKDKDTTKKPAYPLNQIYFYLTQGCNLRCCHCWIAPGFDSNASRYATLPVEHFEMVIREARPLGLSGVKLTGGEPLLHPEFKRLLEIVRREQLALNIETNGLLCTSEIAAEIAKSPERFVSISIDGADAETHDRVRGVPGSFEGAKQAVRNLVAADTPPQVIMSVMLCNADQLDAVVRMAERLGAASVKFNVVQPAARGAKLHEAVGTLSIAKLISLGRYVDMELAKITRLQLFFDYPPAFRPLSKICNGNGFNTCGILGILGVIASGHYALCGIGTHVPELVFGAIGKKKLEEVWGRNRTLAALRKGLPHQLTGVCNRCLMKYRCLGACIAQNYYDAGTPWAPFWFCKQAQEAGLFPESRLTILAA